MLNILWIIAITSITISGMYYTFKLKFIQFRFIKMFKSLFSKNDSEISYSKILFMTLAGKIGVGSIAGVCLSIHIGGYGTIFWMLIISLISLTNTFVETYLGCYYQKKDKEEMIGGPSFYIKEGLKDKSLSILYSIIIIISYVGGFISIQANTIVKVVSNYIIIKKYIIGIILSLITFFILKGGLKKILDVTSKLVPIMLILYLSFLLTLFINNLEEIDNVLYIIIKDAFKIKPFISGFLVTIFIGIQRGIFSNESGMGTGSIASSIGNVDPIKMGYIQMLGVYLTTFVICFLTAFAVIITKYNILDKNINGIEIALLVFKNHFGILGEIILTITIILFAFSTILTGYYYSESSLKFLMKTNDKKLLILKIINIFFIFVGTITAATKLWEFVDFLVAILLIINSYAIIKLKKVVKI